MLKVNIFLLSFVFCIATTQRAMNDLLELHAACENVLEEPLKTALLLQDIGLLNELIKNIDINEVLSKEGCTPLAYAVKNDIPNMVRYLITHGKAKATPITPQDKENNSILFFAKNEAMKKLLLNFGAIDAEMIDLIINFNDDNGVMHSALKFFKDSLETQDLAKSTKAIKIILYNLYALENNLLKNTLSDPSLIHILEIAEDFSDEKKLLIENMKKFLTNIVQNKPKAYRDFIDVGSVFTYENRAMKESNITLLLAKRQLTGKSLKQQIT